MEPADRDSRAALPSGVGETQPSRFSLAFFPPGVPPEDKLRLLIHICPVTDSGQALIPHVGFKTYHCVQLITSSGFQPSLHPPDLIQSRRKTTASPDDQMVTRGGARTLIIPFTSSPPLGRSDSGLLCLQRTCSAHSPLMDLIYSNVC